jgi:hypothetical protein
MALSASSTVTGTPSRTVGSYRHVRLRLAGLAGCCAILGRAQPERQDSVVAGEHGDGGPEYMGSRRGNSRDVPA